MLKKPTISVYSRNPASCISIEIIEEIDLKDELHAKRATFAAFVV